MARPREEAMKRTEPTKSLLQNGPYTPADKTDIRARLIEARTTQQRANANAGQEEFRIDAERYRLLRRQHWDGALCVVMRPTTSVRTGSDCPRLWRLDAAIDVERRRLLRDRKSTRLNSSHRH